MTAQGRDILLLTDGLQPSAALALPRGEVFDPRHSRCGVTGDVALRHVRFLPLVTKWPLSKISTLVLTDARCADSHRRPELGLSEAVRQKHGKQGRFVVSENIINLNRGVPRIRVSLVDQKKAKTSGEVLGGASRFNLTGVPAGQVELGGDFVLAGNKYWRL